MSSLQRKAYQDEPIVSEVILLIKLNPYIISINQQILELKSYDSLFNYLVKIVKNNQVINVKYNNRTLNQKIKTLKSFAISRFHMFYQTKKRYILYFNTKFLSTVSLN